MIAFLWGGSLISKLFSVFLQRWKTSGLHKVSLFTLDQSRNSQWAHWSQWRLCLGQRLMLPWFSVCLRHLVHCQNPTELTWADFVKGPAFVPPTWADPRVVQPFLCLPSTCLDRSVFEAIGKAYVQHSRTTSPGVYSASGEYPELGLRPFKTPSEEIGLEIITRLTSFWFGVEDGDRRGTLTKTLSSFTSLVFLCVCVDFYNQSGPKNLVPEVTGSSYFLLACFSLCLSLSHQKTCVNTALTRDFS